MKYFFYLSVFILFIISCKGTEEKSDEIHLLTKKYSIEDYGENNFFSDVRCISFTEKHLYFSDYNNSELYKYSKEGFKLEKVIGGFGEGPGEINGLSKFLITDNNIILQNDMNRSFEIFENDVFNRTYRLPVKFTDLSFRYRFTVDKQNLYSSHSYSLSPIVKVSLKDNSFNVGGEPYKYEYETQNRIRNNNHVFKFKENLITVSDNMPTVKIYDMDFNLKRKVSLEGYSEVKESLDFIRLKELEEDDSGYRVLFEDAYLVNDKLFILLSSYNPYNTNKILVFKIKEDGDLLYNETIYLNQESNYSAIATDDQVLAAFNTETTFVDIFDLKK